MPMKASSGCSPVSFQGTPPAFAYSATLNPHITFERQDRSKLACLNICTGMFDGAQNALR
jgi:hypothetical protein